ncbi:MAG: heavy metal translocating P-type ATPase [Pseudomonadota bacterium]
MSAVCPGCAAGAEALPAPRAEATPTHTLILPHIHCAGCIRTVETTLVDQPGIRSARVNLTRKRVAIGAEPDADPTVWIGALARAGIEAHEAHDAETAASEDRDLLVYLGVAGFAMMNVMLLSVAVWSGAVDTTREFLHWVSAAIALPATFFAAQPFFRTAWSALRVGRVNMDVPISVAILLASLMSLYEVSAGGRHAWFDAALSLTFFLLAGRVLDQRMRRAARSAADTLAALEPVRVTRIEGDARVSRKLTDIAVDDTLWLAAGARVPVDAELLDAEVRVDRSAITGESDPVTRVRGAALTAGDVVLTGPVSLRATAVGEDTTLRRLAQLVATAEGARGHYRSLADRAAALYTPVVHIVAAAAFLGWILSTGDVRLSINVAIATLIITCPCALGLAVPAVAVAATSRLYARGLLVKSDTALERLAEIDTVILDKTGTLTTRVSTPPSRLPPQGAQILTALAETSDHPQARSVARALGDVAPALLDDIIETPGEGIEATWQGTEVRFGKGAWLGGTTDVAFRMGDTVYPIETHEALLPDADRLVADLGSRGLAVLLVTGDTAENAARTGNELGIAEIRASVRPEDKAAIVAELQAAGAKVLMVGDGINDTAALAAADASIAPGTALEASRNAADVVLVSGRLAHIGAALDTAKMAKRRIVENFWLSLLYNAIAVPVAVAGLATPLLAALAMSASSITVILNSARVR